MVDGRMVHAVCERRAHRRRPSRITLEKKGRSFENFEASGWLSGMVVSPNSAANIVMSASNTSTPVPWPWGTTILKPP